MPLSRGGKEEPELRAALAADAAKLIPGEAVRHCLQARWCAPAARSLPPAQLQICPRELLHGVLSTWEPSLKEWLAAGLNNSCFAAVSPQNLPQPRGNVCQSPPAVQQLQKHMRSVEQDPWNG